MNKRSIYLVILGAIVLVVVFALAGTFTVIPKVRSAPPSASETRDQQMAAADGEVVLSYAAKFVCTAAQPAGVPFYGTAAPIVQQTTEILVHNPNDHPVEISKIAYLSPVEPIGAELPDPMPMLPYGFIPPGASFSIDCSDIASHLLGMQFLTGVTYEGIVTVVIGPHQMAEEKLFPQLDVFAEYTRGSEVLKKDIHYQPWWTYWPWDYVWGDFPFALGFPYQRLFAFADPPIFPYDCRDILNTQLEEDILFQVTDPEGQTILIDALARGYELYFRADIPGDPGFQLPPENPDPALIPIIGRCDTIMDMGMSYLQISYVIVSNHAPQGAPIYPWIPGRWFDMPVVIPQNTTLDFDYMFKYWHAYLWADHINFSYGPNDLYPYLDYFFPYYAGWSGWWWNYNGTDSIDIGVGEGESIDVEQIMPLRLVQPWHIVDITSSP
jgi:hypothetical protein